MASKNIPPKRTPPAAPSGKKSTGKPAPSGSSPLIDTNLAANAAAAMIGNKSAAPLGTPKKEASKESAAFKQLKAGLNKPNIGALGGAFTTPEKQKKANLPFGGGKQVGHNQTFGSEATRSGVPRRTSG